jgi:hypothetical protein
MGCRRKELEAMTDQQLDAAVASAVFGWKVLPVQQPRYCNSWFGFGCVVERMREKGFTPTMELAGRGQDPTRLEVGFWSADRCVGLFSPTPADEGSNIPRAAAIAAVLSCEYES